MAEVEYEFQVEIGGKIYGMDSLTSVHIKQPLFDKMDVGLACCAEMEVSYYIGDIGGPPRGAKLIPRCRPKVANSNWVQLGVFYIDLRTTREGKQTLTCYDSMMFADTPFLDHTQNDATWPRNMRQVAQEISQRMGVPLDPRTQLVDTYEIEYPNDSPMRVLLQYIAAAHAGNWIVTSQNKLLLVPLATSVPIETYYLIDEYGNAIVFGRDRILV